MLLDIKQNEPLKNHSTFRIGGTAKYFCVVKNAEEIKEAIDFAGEKKLPYVVIGSGSNILFRDEGFNGIIIKVSDFGFRISDLNVIASAGTPFAQLISKTTEAGLSGLEWGIGIPGTIGGCVAGNCGAFGKSISESVKKVKTLDREYLNEECGFKYRDSRFKNFSRSDLDGKKVRPLPEIILEVELELKPGDREKIREQINDNLLQRKGRIPPYPSIGCIFKNLKSQIPARKCYASSVAGGSNLKSVSAGKMIEECGLKGKRVGDAQISELHADIIVNLGNATAKDVLELMEICRQKVREKFGVDLENEIVII